MRGARPFALGIAAALVAIFVYNVVAPGPTPLSQRDVSESIAKALASVTPPPARSEQAYEAVRPSLVLIQTTEPPGGDGASRNALGSGVVVDGGGDILTSLHVVATATRIRLTFADGTQSDGQVVARTPEHDIAVVRATAPPATLTPATLGNPGALRIGDDAFVVGNPLGLTGSISAGVVSGLNRSFKLPNTDRTLDGLIQVDAAVNPGNSGGPLLNRDGQVVGIVAALINPTNQDVFIGIGLAVPIDVAGGAAGLPPD
ncbi:MAG TPA: trypsin-like peptidase domain-containing protein [Candidatus Limnocylindrales bacterium]|nr:trypsin-like peptidase domain-containing protein [Candidatus Limnocylindrales bacterium]